MSIDVDKLREALGGELRFRTTKQKIGKIRDVLVQHGHECPTLTEDTLARFLAGKTTSPKPEVLQALRTFLRIANPDEFRKVEAPTSQSTQLALLDAIKEFFVLDDDKQQRLASRLSGRYTIIRDAWMEGTGRKNEIIISQVEFTRGGAMLLTACETQKWIDEELLQKERMEKEFGIAVQFRSNFALFLRTGHSSGGMLIHIFDDWQEGDKITRASGVSVPIVSKRDQIPTAILMTEQPAEELGGLGRRSRHEFFQQFPKLGDRFIDTEERHFLIGDRQLPLPLFSGTAADSLRGGPQSS